MADDGSGILGQPDATAEEVRRAMGHGIFKALSGHKRDGQAIAVWDWENDRVALISAENIELPPEYEPVHEAAGLDSNS